MRTKPSALILLLLLLCTLPWLPMTPSMAASGDPSAGAALGPPSAPPALPDELLRDATLVLRRALDAPSAAIPASIMMRARGIAVFPAARADGGIHYGTGVMSAKGPHPLRWTPPAILAFRGAIPVALETTTVDVVFIALTPRGLDHLTHSHMLPLDTRIVPGPLGQDTPMNLDADLLGYMQFGDYFAGVSIEKWTLVGMSSMNQQLYGRSYSTDDLIRGAGFFNPPPAAQAWRNAIASYFREIS